MVINIQFLPPETNCVSTTKTNHLKLSGKQLGFNLTITRNIKPSAVGLNAKFLGAFAKLRKATINFVMCLSVRMELASQWTDFHEF